MKQIYKIYSALTLIRTCRTICWQFTAILLLCGVIRVETSDKLTKDLGVYKTTDSRGKKRSGLHLPVGQGSVIH